MANLALCATTACNMNVEYARPASVLHAPSGKALVFTRLRFFDDGVEHHPWGLGSATEVLLDSNMERHIWLRRLDRVASSAELQPDMQGSLAIWLPPGDYALLGIEGKLTTTPIAPMPEVVALLRVPDGPPVIYAGELVFAKEHPEGWHAGYMFGGSRVTTQQVEEATGALVTRLGSLPGQPAVSAWCVGHSGSSLPQAKDPDLVARARQLLDAACSTPP